MSKVTNEYTVNYFNNLQCYSKKLILDLFDSFLVVSVIT